MLLAVIEDGRGFDTLLVVRECGLQLRRRALAPPLRQGHRRPAAAIQTPAGLAPGYPARPPEVETRSSLRAEGRWSDPNRRLQTRRREPVPVEDHTHALLLSISGDLRELTDDVREHFT